MGEPATGLPAHGLALLYRRGLPAWLAQMTHQVTDRAEEPATLGGRDAPPDRVGERATEAVVVLASMVLAPRGGS